MWFDQCLEEGRGSSIDHPESDAGYYRELVEVAEEGSHMGEFR